MTVLESLPIAFFCIAMVFILLACVCGLIKLLSLGIGVLGGKDRKSAAVPVQRDGATVVEANLGDFSAGMLTLKDVDEPTAAIIMAIVSDESGIPISELCFKSIRLKPGAGEKLTPIGENVMIYLVKINATEYEVEVEKGQANIIKTTEKAAPFPAAVPPSPSPAVTANTASVSVSGSHSVKSPMPGTITDIKVQPGKSVNQGEVLLILEAMKMENEVAAPVNGVIAQVLVAKGSSVATGDVLITIK